MARAKAKAETAASEAAGSTPAPKKRRGRPPKSSTTAKAAPAGSRSSNGRKKRKVGRPPKADAAPKTAKKRVGRPPKAKAETTTKKRVGRPRKAVAEDDGRRVPVSTATTRAVAAADRAADALKKERTTLAQAIAASDAARTRARASGERRDKTLAKKARQKVQRITDKVVARRTTVRETKANVVKQKAQDLLNARLNNIDVRLRRAEEAATANIQSKVDRDTEKFRTAAHEKLAKAEARKSKARSRQAEEDRAALRSKYEATVQAADESLIPKQRKKRRRRRAA